LPSPGGFPASQKERGDIIGVYAVAVFKDGTRTFVLMGKDEIDRIRDGSSGLPEAMKYGKDTRGSTHYEEMALKTAIRRLCKTLPKSPELAQALALEDAHGRGRRRTSAPQGGRKNLITEAAWQRSTKSARKRWRSSATGIAWTQPTAPSASWCRASRPMPMSAARSTR
jgi:recombinational DNA repair protein RecT